MFNEICINEEMLPKYIYIYIYIYIYMCIFRYIYIYNIYKPDIGLAVRVFANRPGDLGFNPRSSHTKDSKKWYLMPPCLTLSIIRYGSRVKWSNPGKEVAPSPTPWCSKLSKKGAFGSPSTMVAYLLFFYIYIYIY